VTDASAIPRVKALVSKGWEADVSVAPIRTEPQATANSPKAPLRFIGRRARRSHNAIRAKLTDIPIHCYQLDAENVKESKSRQAIPLCPKTRCDEKVVAESVQDQEEAWHQGEL
jgi:hypothetical protein